MTATSQQTYDVRPGSVPAWQRDRRDRKPPALRLSETCLTAIVNPAIR